MLNHGRRAAKLEPLGLLSLDGIVSEKMALDALSLLRALPGDPPIRGLIVLVSSGGGSLGAAQAIVEGIETVASELEIPTVALVQDLALSAGFYVALAADRVLATRAASLGGAGAVIRTFSLAPLLVRLGVDYQALASGGLKDALFPLARHSDEQQHALQTIVDDNSAQFIAHVECRRPQGGAAAAELLGGGRMFTGDAALRAGLIDQCGGLFAAITVCSELAGLAAPSLRVLGQESSAFQRQNGLAAMWSALLRMYP